MGGSASTEISGQRVFKVNPGSPAAEAGLEVFFDFIVAVNGEKFEPGEQSSFAKAIKEAENGTAKLTVFNTRANVTREVTVAPRQWAGNGLLGATVRFDSIDPAENHGIRVLEVFPNSPAAHAGLVPFQDYLLGTAQRVFHDIDELADVVNANLGQRVQVFAYNTDSETVREALLVPNNEWGGEGCIGCDIGTGLLHRIPPPRRAVGTPGAISAPSYPPGTGPQAAPLPVAPRVAAAPAVPSVTGVASSGIPSVPSAAPGAGLPGIRPGGTWAPTAPTPAQPTPGAVPTPGQAGGAPMSAEGMAQLQAQIQQMGLATQGSAQVGAQLPGFQGVNVAEGPKAPANTPMNMADMPGAVDLSAVMDPTKFAGTSSPTATPTSDGQPAPVL